MLKINDLQISIDGESIVRDISFTVNDGEILGIVGESGSGKTMTMLGVAGLLADNASVIGSVCLDGVELLGLKKRERRAYNGKDISYIFQEPMTALNPLIKVGEQVEEVLALHTDMDKETRKKSVLEILELMEFENPAGIYEKYPHELSGGMRQRIIIAMAAVLKPKLIVADEPTTALDVQTGEAVLGLIRKINERWGTMIVLISHDLNVVKSICQSVVVMRSGNIVESGKVREIFESPKEDYTRTLLDATKSAVKTDIYNAKENFVHIDNVDLYYMEKYREKIFSKTRKRYISRGITFDIKRGEILGLLGGSGCGKSTLSRVLAGLKHNYEGDIRFASKKKPNIKMVFQDPYSSLNPSMKVGDIIKEPLRNMMKSADVKCTNEEIKQKVYETLEMVGLDKKYYDKYPRELSGGQRQRVSIGAAIITNPDFIIADEPVSALDATVCQQILQLFVEIQKKYRITMLMISHDVLALEKTCDRVIKWENITKANPYI